MADADDRLISIDTTEPAGQQLPAAVRAELAVLDTKSKLLNVYDDWSAKVDGTSPDAGVAQSGQHYLQSHTPGSVAKLKFSGGWLTNTDTATSGQDSSGYVFVDAQELGSVGDKISWQRWPVRFGATTPANQTAVCIAFSIDLVTGVKNIPVHVVVKHDQYAVQAVVADVLVNIAPAVAFSGGSMGTQPFFIDVGHDRKNGVVYVRDPFGYVRSFTDNAFLTGGRFAYGQVLYTAATTAPRAYIGAPLMSTQDPNTPLAAGHPVQTMRRQYEIYGYAAAVLGASQAADTATLTTATGRAIAFAVALG